MAKPFVRVIMMLVCGVLLSVALRAQQTVTAPAELVQYPDLIIYNAKIMKMNDPSLTNAIGDTVQALAVRGDRIQFMGTDAEVMRFAGPQTRKLDLKGRTVIPGMIDTHSHMHDHTVQLWTRNHAKEVESVVKRFSVTGNTFQELSHG